MNKYTAVIYTVDRFNTEYCTEGEVHSPYPLEETLGYIEEARDMVFYTDEWGLSAEIELNEQLETQEIYLEFNIWTKCLVTMINQSAMNASKDILITMI